MDEAVVAVEPVVAVAPAAVVDLAMVADSHNDGCWLDGAAFSPAEPQGWEQDPVHHGAAIEMQLAAHLSAALHPLVTVDDSERLQASVRKLRKNKQNGTPVSFRLPFLSVFFSTKNYYY